MTPTRLGSTLGSWLAIAALAPAPVRPGLEVLLTDSLHLVTGRAVGLVTNHAGVDRHGTHAVDRLRGAGVRLVALFSPEHGFRGQAAPGEAIASSRDSATGLPIHSLYGRSLGPTDEMLRGVEVLLVDLPDVGARYYTYLSTTLEVMKAAARNAIRVVVLDRPNPIGGRTVQGNLLDPAHRSFVGALTVPMRHGMTLGELARLGNVELGLGAELVVVPALGWRRRDDLLDTGLPFLPPSPHLADRDGLFHYPGICLFEGTALSVGRGTDRPFHQIGAPWLDTAAVLRLVRAARPRGVRLEGMEFTPRSPADGKYPGVAVAGIRLVVTDRHSYDAVRAALLLLAAIRRVHPDSIGFRAASFDRLAGGPALREAILRGEQAAAIERTWRAPLATFRERRRPFLLYR
jgi:uncharacterized protein YbbC (DUF1343 family)